MNLLLHGKKFSKNIGEQIINFIDEIEIQSNQIWQIHEMNQINNNVH